MFKPYFFRIRKTEFPEIIVKNLFIVNGEPAHVILFVREDVMIQRHNSATAQEGGIRMGRLLLEEIHEVGIDINDIRVSAIVVKRRAENIIPVSWRSSDVCVGEFFCLLVCG